MERETSQYGNDFFSKGMLPPGRVGLSSVPSSMPRTSFKPPLKSNSSSSSTDLQHPFVVDQNDRSQKENRHPSQSRQPVSSFSTSHHNIPSSSSTSSSSRLNPYMSPKRPLSPTRRKASKAYDQVKKRLSGELGSPGGSDTSPVKERKKGKAIKKVDDPKKAFSPRRRNRISDTQPTRTHSEGELDVVGNDDTGDEMDRLMRSTPIQITKKGKGKSKEEEHGAAFFANPMTPIYDIDDSSPLQLQDRQRQEDEFDDGFMFISSPPAQLSSSSSSRKTEHSTSRLQLEEGQAFFAEVKGSEEKLRKRAQIDDDIASPTIVRSGVSPDLEGESEDETLICPFCDGPMPEDVDPDLIELKTKLVKISKPIGANGSSKRALAWDRTIDFCSWHEALTTYIPIGLSQDWPSSIDFEDIPRRLEDRWIRKELVMLAKYPVRSKVWVEYTEEIVKMGKDGWKRMRRTNEALGRVHAGYFGGTGKLIIIQHLTNLLNWGYFPTLSQVESTCHPLPVEDFIHHILLPEASTLLIMEDLKSLPLCSNLDDERSRKKAEEVWGISYEYGKWKFREESSECERVLRRMKLNTEELRRMVKDQRKKSGTQKKRSCQIIEIHDGPETLEHPIEAFSDSQLTTTSEFDSSQPVCLNSPSPKSNAKDQSQNGYSHLVPTRTFSKVESFDSGYGDSAINFDDVDFGQIDQLISKQTS